MLLSLLLVTCGLATMVGLTLVVVRRFVGAGIAVRISGVVLLVASVWALAAFNLGIAGLAPTT